MGSYQSSCSGAYNCCDDPTCGCLCVEGMTFTINGTSYYLFANCSPAITCLPTSTKCCIFATVVGLTAQLSINSNGWWILTVNNGGNRATYGIANTLLGPCLANDGSGVGVHSFALISNNGGGPWPDPLSVEFVGCCPQIAVGHVGTVGTTDGCFGLCGCCEAVPVSFQLIQSGVTGGNGSCGFNFNNTYTLHYQGGCVWQSARFAVCGRIWLWSMTSLGAGQSWSATMQCDITTTPQCSGNSITYGTSNRGDFDCVSLYNWSVTANHMNSFFGVFTGSAITVQP